MSYIPGGAGFQPSTGVKHPIKFPFHNLSSSSMIPKPGLFGHFSGHVPDPFHHIRGRLLGGLGRYIFAQLKMVVVSMVVSGSPKRW